MPFTLRPLKTVDDALRHFIQALDLEMVELLLKEMPEDDPGEHQDLLRRLGRAFDYFKDQGDEQLNVIQGKCTKCFPTSTGFYFVGNKSKAHMHLLFHRNDQGILSVFECTNFKTQFTFKHPGKRVYLEDESFRIFTLGDIKDDDVPF
ncbi:MAG: hypothetical protein K9I25_08740 [Crocinitomicaceae bacterium]|jgi:hypothetical protein|nr:hypothetical protein [Crocinitomicaceae bacterium]